MTGKRDVLIKLPLSIDEAARFEGRMAMIVPLSEAEAVEVRNALIMGHDTMKKVAQALSTLAQVLEARGSQEPDIRKVLENWREPTRAVEGMLDRTRELLGRAYFVGADGNAKGATQ